MSDLTPDEIEGLRDRAELTKYELGPAAVAIDGDDLLRLLSMAERTMRAEAEVERLRAELQAQTSDLTECTCGCPLAEHESYDEDGIACGRDGHECLPCWPAAATMLRDLRARLAVAERVVEAAQADHSGADAAVYCTEGRENQPCRVCDALAEWEALPKP